MIDWLLVDYGETISTPCNSGAVNELAKLQGKTRPSCSGATGTHAPTTTSAITFTTADALATTRDASAAAASEVMRNRGAARARDPL